MSGFVGLVMLDGAPVDRPLLQRLTAFMAFRGPDEQGLWSEGEAGLGHALLRTTFEAEQEHQPFSLDHQVWIAGDIRLDGRTELIEALRAQAQPAKLSAPDAELALQAYAAWGAACVEHLIGDFAFAVWDGRQRQLFCARDQFGVCPFYYAQLAEAFVFGNTMPCLRQHPGVSAQLNEQAIADFLLFRHNQDQTTTTFAGIRCLPPAHCLTLAGDQLQIRRYWQWPEAEIRFRSPQDTVEQFKTLFEQAIADRLRTDRVAVPMSGGMDSSSLAVTACRVAPPGSLDLRAFTLTMDHVTSDEEGHYARLVAAHAGIPIRFIQPTPKPAIDIDLAPRAAPEPVTLPSHNGQAMLGQEVVAFSRVMLSGFGGDPLFLPAPGFLLELVKRGRWHGLARAVGQHWRLLGRLPSPYVLSALRNRFGRERWPPLPAWLNPSLVARLDLRARWVQGLTRVQMGDPRRDMSGLPFWTSLLTRHDPGFSSAPLKTRFPFFDVRLLNFVLTTPPVPWFENKTLLREALRGTLPETVRLRRKAAFVGDISDLVAHSEPIDWLCSLAETPDLEPFVDREKLLQIVRAPAQSTRQEHNGVRAPLALGYWLRAQAGLERTA